MSDNYKTYYLEDDGTIPNNSELPFLLCPNTIPDGYKSAERCRELLESHQWGGAWVNGIYSYHHYHSTAHEVLAVVQGNAEVIFGGKKGITTELNSGDVVYIPAGVGHCRISSSPDFSVVGAYPEGQTWDLCTGKPEERPGVWENIQNVPRPACDAITGERQPLLDYWS